MTMYVKKAGGIILGADLTRAERQAMEIEINKQLAEMVRKNAEEIEAMILWEIAEQFGLGPVSGPKKLRKFYDSVDANLKALADHYEMDDGDIEWLCSYKLKDKYGIDISEWAKENS